MTEVYRFGEELPTPSGWLDKLDRITGTPITQSHKWFGVSRQVQGEMRVSLDSGFHKSNV